VGRSRIQGAHVAALAQIDTTATQDAGHYDDGFQEPKRVDDGTWSGTPGRLNQREIRVPCQIEDEVFNRLDPQVGGVDRLHRLRVTFAFKDLARADLIDGDTKVAGIRVAAQLLGVYDRRGNLLYDMSSDNIFCEETRPAGFLSSSINLLVCTFGRREQAAKG